MDPVLKRLIEELTRRVDKLAASFAQSQRTKPTSWIQNGGGAKLYGARMTTTWTGATVESEIYDLDGMSYLDNQDVRDPIGIFGALGSGDWMLVLESNGKYYVIAAGCPGTSPLIASPPASVP